MDKTAPELGFQARLAQPAEERAGRMLLPGAFGGGVAPVLYVAVCGEPPRVIGAAALLAWPQGNPPGFKLALRVAEPFRRRGVGSALVAAAIAESRSRQMKAIYAPEPVAVGSSEAAGWTRLGFTACLTENHYEADPRRMAELLEPPCRRMRERGWIPAAARVVPLRDAPAKAVAALYVAHLGGVPAWALGRVRGTDPDSFHPAASLVLMVGDRVGGALLCRRLEPTMSLIDAVIIAPELRLGWANVLLKLEAAQNAVRDGILKLCFTAYETHPDTRQMATATGAALVKTAVIPYRLI